MNTLTKTKRIMNAIIDTMATALIYLFIALVYLFTQVAFKTASLSHEVYTVEYMKGIVMPTNIAVLEPMTMLIIVLMSMLIYNIIKEMT